MKRLVFIFLACVNGIMSFGQTPEPAQDSLGIYSAEDTAKYQHFFSHADPTLQLDKREEEVKEFKKKKPRRKVFYGRKTKKGFTKKGQGERMEIEVFFYLKEWEEPSAYVRDIYWFDPSQVKVMKSRKFKPETSKLLHGPYKRMIDGKVVEQGVYYFGTKHGRWMYLDKEKTHVFLARIDSLKQEIDYQDLKRKEKWRRGWPVDAELSYYGNDRIKIKEVVPYDHTGKLDGKYYSFFPDAHVKEMGMYANGEKVGKWYTYHQGQRKHFKDEVWVYPDWRKRGDQDFEPYLEKKYDINGKVILDLKRKIDNREEYKKKEQEGKSEN